MRGRNIYLNMSRDDDTQYSSHQHAAPYKVESNCMAIVFFAVRNSTLLRALTDMSIGQI